MAADNVMPPEVKEWEEAADAAPKGLVGACAGCGFLGKRKMRIPQAEYMDEATLNQRAAGSLWTAFDGTEAYPDCYLMVTSLTTEMGEDFTAQRRELGTRKVILRDRHCPEWFPYTPGRSPEQHLTRREQIASEKRQQEQAEALVEVVSQNKEIAATLLSVQQSANRQSDRIARIALAVALAALVASCVGAVAQVAALLR